MYCGKVITAILSLEVLFDTKLTLSNALIYLNF